MDLRDPDPALRAAFLRMADEFRLAGESRYRDACALDDGAFAAYVQRLQRRARGEGLERGSVAERTFWLVDSDAVAGVSRLRPRLDPFHERLAGHIGLDVSPPYRKGAASGNVDAGVELLRLTLRKAGEAGLSRVLLCCDPEKAERRRIAEAAGGTFLGEVSGVLPEGDAYRKVRYAVDIR